MIYVLLADGFEEIEALTPVDMLRRAGLSVRTVSISGRQNVHGAHGIDVGADISPEGITEEIDLLILPGGMPGTLNLDAWEKTDELIARTRENGGRLAAICAAPMVLGKRGLLKGKKATCYPGFEKYLDGALVTGGSVVTDGNITTAAGMGVALPFGAELVRLMVGEQEAEDMLVSLQAGKM